MPKIYDTFLLGSGPQDLDVLECRLTELEHAPIHKHVIVEGDQTFTGTEKPFYFLYAMKRFERWADRIRYLPIRPKTTTAGIIPGDAWAREAYSREMVRAGLLDAEPNDLILHGDCDEIINPAVVPYLERVRNEPRKLSLRLHSFAVDWQHVERWHAPSVARFGMVDNFTQLRERPWPLLDGTPYELLHGWHLSWMGGPDAMRTKLYSFSHTETIPMITAGIDAGDYIERGRFWGDNGQRATQLIPVDVNETWPRWIYERKCPANWFRPRILEEHTDATRQP